VEFCTGDLLQLRLSEQFLLHLDDAKRRSDSLSSDGMYQEGAIGSVGEMSKNTPLRLPPLLWEELCIFLCRCVGLFFTRHSRRGSMASGASPGKAGAARL